MLVEKASLFIPQNCLKTRSVQIHALISVPGELPVFITHLTGPAERLAQAANSPAACQLHGEHARRNNSVTEQSSGVTYMGHTTMD